MRDWLKMWVNIQPDERKRFISVKVPKRIMAVYAKTGEASMLVNGANRVVQAIFEAWKNKEDPFVAWALEMLNVLERTAGREKLEQAIRLYLQQTNDCADQIAQAAKKTVTDPNRF
jgi:hypothetical protein